MSILRNLPTAARRTLLGLGLAALMGAAALATSPAARALPPAGTNTLPATGQVSVTSRLGSETIPLSGSATVQHGNSYIQGGVEVADTEILSMTLTGNSLTGPVTVSESPTLVSSGQIRSLQPSPSFPASSYFNVFIVVTVPASPSPTITLHNDAALRVDSQSSLTTWPPPGVRYAGQPNPCVPLLPSLPKQACLTSLSFALGTPDPVGGIAELPQLPGAPLSEADGSGPGAGAVAGIAGGAALGAIALAGAAWQVRRSRATRR